MEIIGKVLEVTFFVLNTRLTFGPFSFTIMAAMLGISVIAVIVYSIKELFDS